MPWVKWQPRGGVSAISPLTKMSSRPCSTSGASPMRRLDDDATRGCGDAWQRQQHNCTQDNNEQSMSFMSGRNNSGAHPRERERPRCRPRRRRAGADKSRPASYARNAIFLDKDLLNDAGRRGAPANAEGRAPGAARPASRSPPAELRSSLSHQPQVCAAETRAARLRGARSDARDHARTGRG